MWVSLIRWADSPARPQRVSESGPLLPDDLPLRDSLFLTSDSDLNLCFFWVCLLLALSESSVTQSCLTLCDSMDSPLPVGFCRQEYWRGLPFPPPGDLPDPGIKPWTPEWQADYLPAEPLWKPASLRTGAKPPVPMGVSLAARRSRHLVTSIITQTSSLQ